MELPEFFVAPDQSLMRLVPAGSSVFGSSPDEIESAIHLDRDGELFSLENESPQFVAFLPAYYIGVFAITNQQFVGFLSQTRPSGAVLNSQSQNRGDLPCGCPGGKDSTSRR
jgi:formylglycine-generating enzyme required for sulfatase activity